MFNEARGVTKFICDSPGLPLTLQKQLCHSLIQSDLFPSLNSSWPSYWSLLQPSSPHFLLFVPFFIFICIFCSPPIFCWLIISLLILLLIFFPCGNALSWCLSFVCTLTIPPSTLCIWTFLTRSLSLHQVLSCHLDKFKSLFDWLLLHCTSQIIMSFSIYSSEHEIKTESDQCWRGFKRFDFKGTWRGQGNVMMVILWKRTSSANKPVESLCLSLV